MNIIYVCWLYIMCISSYIISYTYYANIYAVLYLWQLCRYRYVWLPGAPFFAWNSIYFWSLLGKNVAASQKRSCSKWSRIARMKGNQHTCCRWQRCHSWSSGNKVDWHGLDGLWALELQPFVPFDCDSDIKKQPKLSKTGVRVKTLLYREETLLSREETPLYWFKAPSPKLFCHGGPSINVSFSTELLWLNVCFKKRLVETSFISTRKSWGIWMSLHDGTVLKTNNGCGWQTYSKMTKKVREQKLR